MSTHTTRVFYMHAHPIFTSEEMQNYMIKKICCAESLSAAFVIVTAKEWYASDCCFDTLP